MKRLLIATAAVAMLAAWGETSATAASLKGLIARREAPTYSWHGGYYDAAWGAPVALVVPPNAENQTHYNWGIGGTRTTPIQHQFERDYPGPGAFNRAWFRPTPPWPSSTDQFGDYYIRGPW
jgi:hypothetical protein